MNNHDTVTQTDRPVPDRYGSTGTDGNMSSRLPNRRMGDPRAATPEPDAALWARVRSANIGAGSFRHLGNVGLSKQVQ